MEPWLEIPFKKYFKYLLLLKALLVLFRKELAMFLVTIVLLICSGGFGDAL